MKEEETLDRRSMKDFILEPLFIFLAAIAFLVVAIFSSAIAFVFGRWSATLLGWY